MHKFTKTGWFRLLSVKLIFLHLFQISFPLVSLGLTSGPRQPEFAGFGQSASSELVNLFTGDFSYDIPLMDVDGYPINLHYDQNVQMNEEASWVGLGWNLNVGAVNRNLRGIPDDFDGDNIQVERNLKTNEVSGTRIGYGLNILMFNANWGSGEFNSSYKGPGTDAFANIQIGTGIPILPTLIPFYKWQNKSFGLGYTANSQTGVTISPSYGYGHSVLYGTLGIGYTKNVNNTETSYYNSRHGLTHTQMTHSKSWNAGVDLSWISAIAACFLVFIPPVGVGIGSGTNGSTTVPVGTNKYTVAQSMNMFNFGSSTTKEWGGTLLGLAKGSRSKSTYNDSQVSLSRSEALPGYGYFFLHNSMNDHLDVLDFNREFNTYYIPETMPNISPSQNTMDLFTASAAGVSANFRPKRYDVGMNHDGSNASVSSRHDSYKKRLYGIFSIYLLGLPEEKVKGTNSGMGIGYSGKWLDDHGNEVDHSQFEGFTSSNVGEIENVAFKNIGEKVVSDEAILESYGGTDPSYFLISELNESINIENVDIYHRLLGGIKTGEDVVYDPVDEWTSRQPRQELFGYKPAGQKHGALITDIESYEFNTSATPWAPTVDVISRTHAHRHGHHMSEVEIDKSDGTRYVYGVPVYNILEKNVSFNASGCEVDEPSREVEYIAGFDNSMNNLRGRNNHFESEMMPPYAHSFLLSAVLSADYSDFTGDGPTPDDNGNYTKFNYTKDENYRWRVPYSEGAPSEEGFPVAAYSANFKTDSKDDMGTYVYGEREQWYLHSVESKNHIAEFYLSDRDDGLGVVDENGEKDEDVTLKKLDKIVLFDREDRLTNQADAVPIKTVEFTYDYSLCPGVPNHAEPGMGKLTLKEVRISVGESKRGRLSPYVFTYDEESNFEYNSSHLDRWGNYKPNTGSVHNSEFPYSEQNAVLADQYARAWKMDRIQTPTGSVIDVTYESDDYAYVQNRDALSMFPIAGFGAPGEGFSTENRLFISTGQDITQYNSFNRLFVDVENDVNEWAFKSKYLDGIKYLYFKCEINLDNDGGFETVNGYAEIKGQGVVDVEGNKFGYIDLLPVPINDVEPDASESIVSTFEDAPKWLKMLMPYKQRFDDNIGNATSTAEKINPIAKAGWQFTRLNLPDLIYPPDVDLCDNALNVFKCKEDVMKKMGYDIDAFSKGEHGMLKNRNFSSRVNLNQSWIRLRDPDGAKKGGGARVSKIEVRDAWADMTDNGETSVYGTEYTYEDGVASYEPMLGNDENPFRLPINYSTSKILAPDDHHYQEEPIGESFYPGPLVGYSLIEVKPLNYSGVTKHAIGKDVYEFYTARNFPVVVKKTENEKRSHNKEHLEGFVMDNFSPNLLAASQGFTIEINDMHGKPKARSSYSGVGLAEYRSSAIEFNYKEQTYSHPEKGEGRLSSNVNILKPNMTLESAAIGMESDVFIDTRESFDININIGNTSTRKISLFSSWNTDFGLSADASGYKSVALTKLISRSGILVSVKNTIEDKITYKTDLAWDAKTGQVLLSKVENDFDDPIYLLTQPAYWLHEGMGPAYINRFALRADVQINANGEALMANPSDYFFKGDEVLVSIPSLANPVKCWVTDVSDGLSTVTLVDINGNPMSSDPDALIQVVRSGRRNLQSYTMQQIVSTNNPVNSNEGVLHASATEYSEEWQFGCEDLLRCQGTTKHCDESGNNCTDIPIGGGVSGCEYNDDDVLNPYVFGTLGAWRPTKSMYFEGNRTQTSISGTEDLRKDGCFEEFTFNPYWVNSGSAWSKTSIDGNWRIGGEMTKYDGNGRVLELKDANGDYSAAVYGYNDLTKRMVVATAKNARYRQIGFDGFEDYDYQSELQPCGKADHFSFREGLTTGSGTVEVTTAEFHTGKRSLKLTPNSAHSMVRKIGECAEGEGEYPTEVTCEEIEEAVITAASNECLGTFNPMCGEYTIGAWVKAVTPVPYSTYDDLASIEVRILDDYGVAQGIFTLEATGPIINGWQRISGDFVFEAFNLDCIKITLKNTSTDLVFFDDVRVNPVNSEMITYVYDQKSSRMIARLDQNNFATYIHYNKEGVQSRVLAETLDGVVTKSETYSSLRK